MSTMFRRTPHQSSQPQQGFGLPPQRTCDRCGAPAVALSHHIAGELAWCGHHFRQLTPVFREQAVPVSVLQAS